MIQYDKHDFGETVRFQCGGNFTTLRGILASPSYPEAYPEDQSCIYTITLPKGSFINITFSLIDIRCNDEVGSDYLEIRDGGSDNSPLMIRDCSGGKRIPETMQSTQNFLWIK